MDLIYCSTKMSDEFAGILMTWGPPPPPCPEIEIGELYLEKRA